METVWRAALSRQFCPAIDMLDSTLRICPASLWTRPLWPVSASSPFPSRFAEFWYVGFHVLTWLDLYFQGVPEEAFRPPAPFLPGERDSAETVPDRPYAAAELRDYLASLRAMVVTTLTSLTDEHASRLVDYPWTRGDALTWLELQLYNLRHLQEHTAQLSLMLGQNGVPGEDLSWIARGEHVAIGILPASR